MGTIRKHPVARDRNQRHRKPRTNTTTSPAAIKLRMPARVRRNLVSRLIFSATRHAASTATPMTSKTTSESRSRASRVVSKAARSFTDVCIAKYSVVPHPAVLRAHEELTLAAIGRELETDRSSVLSRADFLLNASLVNHEDGE